MTDFSETHEYVKSYDNSFSAFSIAICEQT
jgi:hypothetical protein